MKTTKITLAGSTEYNDRFPPRDAKKGYVARITGRAAGAVKYAREFLGSDATLLEGDEGLYERQIGNKKGGCTRYYHVILSHPEHGLMLSGDCDAELPKIAKLLDDGVSIEDAVEVTDLRPSQKVEGRMAFTAIARTKTQASKAAVGQTIDSAVAACWAAMCNLPDREAKAVLKAIKSRMTPAPAASSQLENVPCDTQMIGDQPVSA